MDKVTLIQDIKNKIKTIKAYVVKDLKISFRFRMSLVNKFFAPVLTMLSFMVTYSAIFFGTSTDDLGFVDRSNYVIYLLTGFLAYSVFRLAWGITNLGSEVGGYTLFGIWLAPGSRAYLLAGKGVRALVEILISAGGFAAMLIFLRPNVYWSNLLVGIVAVGALFLIFLSLDFVVSAIGLVNPGLAGVITNYIPKGFLLIGCAYFPIDVIPEIIRPLVYVNPLYHAVNLFRSGFMTADLQFGMTAPLIYLLVLAVVMPIISIYLFEQVFKKWHVRGL